MKPPRVLIVDDNILNIVLARFVLAEAAFEVEQAMNAEEAVARIGSFCPDVILMDIQMPGMTGLELTVKLKADPATKHIPIVAFTAYAMPGEEARMLAAGCVGYIPKPIDTATFAGKVRSYCDLH